MFFDDKTRLRYKYDAEELWIEPWGPNAFRVRATKAAVMPSQDWALQKLAEVTPEISITDESASIKNGNIKARISRQGKLIIEKADGKLILEEYSRHRRDLLDPKCSALEVEAREFKGI